MIFPYDFFCDFYMIFPIYDISEFFYDFYRIKQQSQENDKKILENHRTIIDILEKSQENPRKAANQFLNPVSINLKKLPQMPASRFLEIVKKPAKFQSAVTMCQFLSPGTTLYYMVLCCSVLQCVAVCCSVLQHVAVCCSVLRCVAVCCSVLQCVTLCCSMLQCVAVLQHVAVCCTVCIVCSL